MIFILDAQLFHWLYGWLHRPPWAQVMSGVTHLGDFKVVLILGALGVSESLWASIRRGRIRGSEGGSGQRALLLPWLGIGVAVAITHWLKQQVGRPRPVEIYPVLAALPGELGRSSFDALRTSVLSGVDGRSFPSGHATAAFALATAFSLRWPRARGVWFGMAALVALSRVALGLHWPTDTIAGAMIGIGTVFCLAWVERFIKEV